jgi:hypothetical protein
MDQRRRQFVVVHHAALHSRDAEQRGDHDRLDLRGSHGLSAVELTDHPDLSAGEIDAKCVGSFEIGTLGGMNLDEGTRDLKPARREVIRLLSVSGAFEVSHELLRHERLAHFDLRGCAQHLCGLPEHLAAQAHVHHSLEAEPVVEEDTRPHQKHHGERPGDGQARPRGPELATAPEIAVETEVYPHAIPACLLTFYWDAISPVGA